MSSLIWNVALGWRPLDLILGNVHPLGHIWRPPVRSFLIKCQASFLEIGSRPFKGITCTPFDQLTAAKTSRSEVTSTIKDHTIGVSTTRVTEKNMQAGARLARWHHVLRCASWHSRSTLERKVGKVGTVESVKHETWTN